MSKVSLSSSAQADSKQFDRSLETEELLLKSHNLWVAAVRNELAHLSEHITVSTKDLANSISDLSQSQKTENGDYIIPRTKVFQLVQTLQFEDRLQQEVSAISEILEILIDIVGDMRAESKVGMASGNGSIEDINENLLARMRNIVKLGELRQRIETKVRDSVETES